MPAESNRNFNTFTYSFFINLLFIYIYLNNILGHVGFRWVYHEACRGFRSGMQVSDGSQIRHIGLRRVSDGSPIIIIFS